MNKNNQQKCGADTILLDTGEMLTAKMQANLQPPSPAPDLQSSHPRCMTETRLYEAAAGKCRHKIFSAPL